MLPSNNVLSLKKMGKDVLERQNPDLFIAGNIEIIRNNPSGFLFFQKLAIRVWSII